MSAEKAVLENRQVRIKGPLPRERMFIKAARIEEGFSELTRTTVEFMSPDRALDLDKVVGQPITIEIQAADESWRQFGGTCIEAEALGLYQGLGLYTLQLRPWLWFLTRTSDNRIFQDMTVPDIAKKIFGEMGFADFDMKARGTGARVYCVQHRETDFDFLSRLFEEEGIYYWSEMRQGKETLVIADDAGAHAAVPGHASIDFYLREAEYRRREDHVFEWQGSRRVTSGKVTLTDYDFENPRADLKAIKAIPKGSHSHKDAELYDYPGPHRKTALGDKYARIRMEAEAARHDTRAGVGNVRTMGVGQTFTLRDMVDKSRSGDYLITRATHLIQIETDYEDHETRTQILPGRLLFDADNTDTYRCTFNVIPRATPYRTPRKTPWPRIPGLLLATVTGPAGEEIYTDKYGRIKVQFPWDREGKRDENTTCWVRTVMPWTGKGWGFVAIPRIGQEVVIQFEDGDPDRPICTGMLYNADTMPPYALPANMTQSGIQTRSTKGGGAANYNELVFEDKKDAEFIRFHSEKDYFQTVENNAVINIGLDKKDPGDLTQTIHHHKTETIKTGDKTLTVETGSEFRTIATDKTEDIGVNDSLTVGADRTMDIGANLTETVASDMALSVSGKRDVTVSGNITEKSDAKIAISAAIEIKLSVGGSSITIDNAGVTIKAPTVTVSGQAVTKVEGAASLILKGGVTLIN
ncbi:MAG: type VI secretion system tip protein VgrG [Rhodobacteraceae bacterium]|jgi:type VI secretion system secreted protein VgrG|nr:type VI secretion system tip protein VgrG [Paracoccaceae bacterium]